MGKFKLNLYVFSLLGALFCGTYLSYADTGRVYTSDAKLSETAQKAIILHNGEEEVLVLGTDLKADKSTPVLRFIPFPAEPQVILAPPQAFEAAAGLVKSHALKFIDQYKDGSSVERAVELKFNQKLGVHDLTVVKINDAAAFRGWVNSFFKSKSLAQNAAYPEIEAIVNDYTQRGLVYFVFDFVELNTKPIFVEPVAYRFKTKALYYPLKTSNTFGGSGLIDLIVCAPGTLCAPLYGDFYGMKATTSAAVTSQELTDILPDAGAFYGKNNIFIQLLRYNGLYQFGEDILYDLSKAVPRAVAAPVAKDNVLENSLQGVADRLGKQSAAPEVFWEKYMPAAGVFSLLAPREWKRDEADQLKDFNQYELRLIAPQSSWVNYVMAEIFYYADEFKTPEKFIYDLSHGPMRAKDAVAGAPLEAIVAGKKAQAVDISETRYPPLGLEAPAVKVIKKYLVVPGKKGFYVLLYDAPVDLAQARQDVFDKIAASFDTSLYEKTAAAPRPEVEEEEYAVYTAFLTTQTTSAGDWHGFSPQGKQQVYEITIAEKKLDNEAGSQLNRAFGRLEPSLINDYNQKAAIEREIRDRIFIPGLEIYSERQRKQEKGGAERGPGPGIYFSRVGFDQAHQTALFLYYTAGERYFVLMEKSGGKWAVKNTMLLGRVIF